MDYNSQPIFYTSAWYNKDDDSFRAQIPFEKLIPLRLLGQSVIKYKPQARVRVVILEGYENISPNYIKELRALGLDMVDYTAEFKKIVSQYPKIKNYYSKFERNCFLRWIAFKNIIAKEGAKDKQFWHLDSDVILHASLDEIAEDTKGKTFMLQGCPALVSVSDFSWFETYERELKKLEGNIIGYSEEASSKKEDLRKNETELCNQTLYRNPIGSDNDLLGYIVGAGIIKQDNISKVFDFRFSYYQNLLAYTRWHSLQPGNKPLAFVHYQGTFCFFANIYYILAKLGIEKWVITRYLITFNAEKAKFVISPTARVVWKLGRIFGLKRERDDMIIFLESVNPKTGRLYVDEITDFISKDPSKVIRERLKKLPIFGPAVSYMNGIRREKKDFAKRFLFYWKNRSVLTKNVELRDQHVGKKCFILATGPSIKDQDLSRLQGEFCISLSNFFIHPDFKKIKPKYHFFVGSHSPVTDEQFAAWFKDAEAHFPDGQEIFVALKDKHIVDKYGVFKKQKVYYYFVGDGRLGHFTKKVDFTKPLPTIQSSPHLGLYLALYVGCKEINLLGVDHDWLLHFGETRHFYDEKNNAMTKLGYSGWSSSAFEDELRSYITLWGIYKRIRDYAQEKVVSIYNCTPGSLLDVFPRRNLDEAIK